MIKITSLSLGSMQTNCYVVWEENRQECIIIDPAAEAGKIKETIEKLGLTPVALLLTHGHFDHIGAVAALLRFYKLPVFAMAEEAMLCGDTGLNLSQAFGMPITLTISDYLSDGSVLELGGMEIEVIHTPGHTEGSCCFYLEAEGVLFSGDTLFYESHGRTDFPTGSERKIADSIRNKLLELPGDVRVYPGHGTDTTIKDEAKWY